jgi:hypothetical protein
MSASPVTERSVSPDGLLVLNVRVPEELLRQWARWLAPERQPFFLTDDEAADLGMTAGEPVTDPELTDTYEMYDAAGLVVSWLAESEFLALPRRTRSGLVRAQLGHGRAAVPTVRRWLPVIGPRVRDQADGHRFVWWPSLLAGQAAAVLPAWAAEELLPGQQAAVADATWAGASSLLPCARELAGTFAAGSGPNCFGTVMAAAGVPGASTTWMQREPFESWLTSATRPGGRDDVPGTVLVWRSVADGLLQHAAVTLGDGWALHKQSQCWYSPRLVLRTADVIAGSRTAGWRLSRRRITGHVGSGNG